VRALVQAVRDCEKQSPGAHKSIQALSISVSGAVDVEGELWCRRLIELVFASQAGRVKIVRAERGDDAGLLGAAWLAFGDGV